MSETRAVKIRRDNSAEELAELIVEMEDEIERLRAALQSIRDELTPLELTNWLSSSGKRIMEIIRAALNG